MMNITNLKRLRDSLDESIASLERVDTKPVSKEQLGNTITGLYGVLNVTIESLHELIDMEISGQGSIRSIETIKNDIEKRLKEYQVDKAVTDTALTTHKDMIKNNQIKIESFDIKMDMLFIEIKKLRDLIQSNGLSIPETN